MCPQFDYPLASVHTGAMGARNAVKVTLDYWKGKGFVLDLNLVQVHAPTPGGMASFEYAPMSDPRSTHILRAAKRNSDLVLRSLWNEAKAQLLIGEGHVYSLLCAYATTYHLELHHNPLATPPACETVKA